MYSGHGRLCVCVCVSAAAFPHYCMDLDVTCGNGRGCPLVVHYWADLLWQLDPWAECFGDKTPASWFFRLRFGQPNFFTADIRLEAFLTEFMARIYIGLIKHTSWHTVLVLHFVLRWWYSANIFCLQCLVNVDDLKDDMQWFFWLSK